MIRSVEIIRKNLQIAVYVEIFFFQWEQKEKWKSEDFLFSLDEVKAGSLQRFESHWDAVKSGARKRQDKKDKHDTTLLQQNDRCR